MKFYDKRIAILISDQHFIPHGGIGQFVKGFTEMANNLNWKVDVVLDQKPSNNTFVKLFDSLNANIIYPEDSYSYKEHTSTFSFSDTVNLEKIINFRKSLLKAFETNIYDMVLCNTQEAMTASYVLTLKADIPVVFYTHLHSMIFRSGQGNDVFLDSYHNFYNKHMEFPDVFIGTQSEKNKRELEANGSKFVSILPMPLAERSLLEPNMNEREGVLFIGRWEEGKNPEAYIRVMKECGLPCRVLTNESGKKKFEKRFKEEGIKNYIIKAGIIGEEKVEFITGSRVFFMPSLRENYPFAFYECLGHMPCVVLDTQEWSDNFLSIYYYKTSIEDASSLINTLYSVMNPAKFYSDYGSYEYVKMLDELAPQVWYDFVNGYKGRQSNSNAAQINKFDKVKYKAFIKKITKDRGHLSREDFESVLTNRHKYKIIYTDINTYLSKDENYRPTEDEENEGEPILKL